MSVEESSIQSCNVLAKLQYIFCILHAYIYGSNIIIWTYTACCNPLKKTQLIDELMLVEINVFRIIPAARGARDLGTMETGALGAPQRPLACDANAARLLKAPAITQAISAAKYPHNSQYSHKPTSKSNQVRAGEWWNNDGERVC